MRERLMDAIFLCLALAGVALTILSAWTGATNYGGM